MQVHVGISATGFSSKQAGVKTNYVGGGISSGVAIGGVIAHNLVLYGAFFGTDTGNPDKQVAGTSMTSDLGEIGVGAFGPGLAYYFERCNLYLSATFGLAGFTANDGGGFKVDSAKSGTAFDFMVGKEWWVSRDWGLGIAGELMAASLKDKNVPGSPGRRAGCRFSSRPPTTDDRSPALRSRMLVGHLRRPRPRRHAPLVRAARALWTLPTNLLGHLAGSPRQRRPDAAAGGRTGRGRVALPDSLRPGARLGGRRDARPRDPPSPRRRRRADDRRAPHAGARARPHAPARPARPAVSAAAHPGARRRALSSRVAKRSPSAACTI